MGCMVHDCRIDLSEAEGRVHLVRGGLHLLLLELLKLMVRQAVLLLPLLTLLVLLHRLSFCKRLLSALLHRLSLCLHHLLLLRSHRWWWSVGGRARDALRCVLLSLLSHRCLLRRHCPHHRIGGRAID